MNFELNKINLFKRETNKKKKLAILTILALLGLNFVYYFIITKEFTYYGYFEQSLSISKLAIGVLLFCTLVAVQASINNDFYLLVYTVILIIYFGGEIVYFQFNPGASIVQPLAYFFSLIFIAVFSKKSKPLEFIPSKKNLDRTLGFIAILMFIPFVILYIRYVNLNNLLFKDIYETRTVFKEISIPFTGYIYGPLSKVLLPVLIVNNIEKRNFKKVLLYVIMLLYLFLIGALKSTFIGLISVIIFYKGECDRKLDKFMLMILMLLYFGILNYLLFDNIFLVDAFVRRVFFVPPHLGNVYQKLFHNNLTYYSHSPLGFGFIKSEFSGIDLVKEVGLYLYGGGRPNVGIITEMIFSFGKIGAILGSLLFSFIIYIIGSLNIRPKYFGIVFIYVYYLNTSLLSTLLLTHGFGFFLILSYTYLRE